MKEKGAYSDYAASTFSFFGLNSFAFVPCILLQRFPRRVFMYGESVE